ncbi:MAG: single-stranded DNA-binding protein [Anaerolineae bacterium]|jgi:single-strand DNA-binding protein
MYHRTTIVGNLGNDPELRQTQTGISVTSFSVAVNERWNDGDGNKQEKTTWYRVTCWRKLAETCAKYLTKGRQVLVEGNMQEPTVWVDKDGNNRASLELTARSVQFLGSANDAGSGGETVVKPVADTVEEIADDEIPF